MAMWQVIVFASILSGFYLIDEAETCNEAVCGSIVSKCLLTQSCKCDFKNYTCFDDCSNCLSSYYYECCSCVDICPKPNGTKTDFHVGEFEVPVPGLFNVLTELPDPQERWNSITFPIDIDISQYAPKKQIKIHIQSAEHEVLPIKSNNIITLNCTVAFWSACMSRIKCKSSCQTMGASSYRWFLDRCCQCIGENCINYGINESRCRNCSLDVEEDEEGEDVDYDYGQEDD